MLIPKIFHQIWINTESSELPAEYAAYRDSWLRMHPGWDYKLWNLDNLDFEPKRMDLIRMSKSYAQMADVLRYEILAKHGGIYVDTDFECLKSMEEVLSDVQNFACSQDGTKITNAIIGAVPGSIYMQRCVDLLPAQVGLTFPTAETGPDFLTRVLLRQGLAGDFTLFPQQWFYPYDWNEYHRAGESFPEAYAVHRWAHSWSESKRDLMTRGRRKLQRLTVRLLTTLLRVVAGATYE